jgi:hypothetical protein
MSSFNYKGRFLDFTSFVYKIYENDQERISGDLSSPEVDRIAKEVTEKIKKNSVWVQIRQGFFGRLLSHLNVYGSSELDPPTMCTDGESIVFHPDFVKGQSNESIRFVIMHEILHCLNNHHERMGNRDPYLWNVACDYAINPLLLNDSDQPLEGLDFPKDEKGEKAGLFERKYEGMNAEDIYDDLIKNAQKQGGDPKDVYSDEIEKAKTGEIVKEGLPAPDKNGKYVVRVKEDEDPESGDKKESQGEGGKEGEGESGEKEGTGPGKPGQEPGKTGDKESSESGKKLPSVGDKVILDDGRETTIKNVYPNGDIEV